MIFNKRDINILNLAMRILEIRNRFCQYGIMTSEEYNNTKALSGARPLVYNPEFVDDDQMYTIFEGYGNTNRYYTDMYVRYRSFEDKADDYIEVAVPVVFEEDCQRCDSESCSDCPNTGYYQLYLIGRDGSISEDICVDETDEDACCGCCDCCPHEDNEDSNKVVAMMQCRESGAHDFCHCECGEEHCFVECGPVNDEDCSLNENGRCHCPHNRCCGCDCECEPDEDD